MTQAEFPSFQAQVFQLYRDGNYTEAFDLVAQRASEFPDQSAIIFYWQICLAALSQTPEVAVSVLAEAIEAGHWWSEQTLRNASDLRSIQDVPAFQELVAVCAGRHEQAKANASPGRAILPPDPPSAGPAPLLIALHGRGSNADEMAHHWKELTRQGWIVALPQSSQIIGMDSYSWDDYDQTEREIRALYEAIGIDHSFDPQRVVLGGFSQGGGRAILLGLQGSIPASGFIVVGPFLQEIEQLDSLVPPEGRPGLRGYMVLGSQDQEYAQFAQLQAVLRSRQVPFEVEEHAELGHEFPPDFSTSLRKALAFLF